VSRCYFAYGSNMAPTVMARLCPGHRCLGVARLDGYRLAFTRRSVRTGSGVADIVAAPGSTVWGVVYEIDEEDLAALDRKEGHGWAYVREHVTVRLESGTEQQAVAYAVRSKEPDVPPSPEYLGGLIAAARERRLPVTYVRNLEKTVAANNISKLPPAD
jgi:gamma-glutamylcyclotransferase